MSVSLGLRARQVEDVMHLSFDAVFWHVGELVMVYRAAVDADIEAIGAFLEANTDTSMFLRANLAEHGPCGGDALDATWMWICETKGRVAGVVGITRAGFVFPQLPDVSSAEGDGIAAVLGGFEINGIIGATAQVRWMQGALGFADAPTQLDKDEPLYSLDLANLVVPATGNVLRPADGGDRALLRRWRESFLMETVQFSPEEAREHAADDVEEMIARGWLMLLQKPTGEPLAMTSFNAILPDMAQIGSVYAPPELRRRGHARDAVAQHLARARAEGMKRAILIAAGPASSRTYESIGFRHIGSLTLLCFAGPQFVRKVA